MTPSASAAHVPAAYACDCLTMRNAQPAPGSAPTSPQSPGQRRRRDASDPGMTHPCMQGARKAPTLDNSGMTTSCMQRTSQPGVHRYSRCMRPPDCAPRPPRRQLWVPADPGCLLRAAASAVYSSSQAHKLSWHGLRVRGSDGAVCPTAMPKRPVLTAWLRDAIALGNVEEPVDGDFPRYVWIRNEHGTFEGRMYQDRPGEYYGYPIHPTQLPVGV